MQMPIQTLGPDCGGSGFHSYSEGGGGSRLGRGDAGPRRMCDILRTHPNRHKRSCNSDYSPSTESPSIAREDNMVKSKSFVP